MAKSRLSTVLTANNTRVPRNWFSKLEKKPQDELNQIRTAFVRGETRISSAMQLAEVVKEHYPEISVRSHEVAAWLRKGLADGG